MRLKQSTLGWRVEGYGASAAKGALCEASESWVAKIKDCVFKGQHLLTHGKSGDHMDGRVTWGVICAARATALGNHAVRQLVGCGAALHLQPSLCLPFPCAALCLHGSC